MFVSSSAVDASEGKSERSEKSRTIVEVDVDQLFALRVVRLLGIEIGSGGRRLGAFDDLSRRRSSRVLRLLGLFRCNRTSSAVLWSAKQTRRTFDLAADEVRVELGLGDQEVELPCRPLGFAHLFLLLGLVERLLLGLLLGVPLAFFVPAVEREQLYPQKP